MIDGPAGRLDMRHPRLIDAARIMTSRRIVRLRAGVAQYFRRLIVMAEH